MIKIVFVLMTIWLVPTTLIGQQTREFTLTQGDTTYTMKKYVFCLLMDGPQRNQDSATVAILQKGHMEHIQKMAATGKLIVAGPFENGGSYRGIFIFDIETIEEAKQLAEQDPSIKAGRMVLEFIPWWAAKGTCLP